MSELVSEICAACTTVATLPGYTGPHRYMSIQGQKRSRLGGYDTFYHCMACNTDWVCHTDKWGFNGGFKVKPTE